MEDDYVPVPVGFCDGACRGNPGPMGIGAVLYDRLGGKKLGKVSQVRGHGTNNQAEYLALIALLELAKEKGLRDLYVQSDSELIIRQMTGEYRVKKPELQPLHRKAWDLASSFDHVEYTHIRRDRNAEADALANQALDTQVPAV